MLTFPDIGACDTALRLNAEPPQTSARSIRSAAWPKIAVQRTARTMKLLAALSSLAAVAHAQKVWNLAAALATPGVAEAVMEETDEGHALPVGPFVASCTGCRVLDGAAGQEVTCDCLES